jgi:hypothetical protein
MRRTQIKQSACQAYSGSASQQASRLCQLIPAIDTQLGASCWQVVQAMGAAALLGLALMLVGTAYLWELAHVAARAAKHKRRCAAGHCRGMRRGLRFAACTASCPERARSLPPLDALLALPPRARGLIAHNAPAAPDSPSRWRSPRYKRRKAGIPWHKLKIEGPMTFCGQPPAQPQPAAEPKDKDA